MTILPKKKASAPKTDTESTADHNHGGSSHYIGQIPSQPAEAHERLFVTGAPSSNGWGCSGAGGSGVWPGGVGASNSPGAWPPTQTHPPAVSREEKRSAHNSPQHYSDYEDSLDGAPSTKRVRHRMGHAHRGRGSKRDYMTPSSSRATPPRPEAEEGEGEGGYNSEDEYSHVGVTLTEEEWAEKDRRFERLMKRKGYVIKQMGEDGACLFRAVADQMYGDQEMHNCVRNQCMDYIERNADYFSNYVTEDFNEYIRRKRVSAVHGNHLEIQALSEMYNRPIHIYCYSSEPINIFQAIHRSDKDVNVPIRLCYHRGVHYNSLVDPNNASIGVGLGLPGLVPGQADKNQLRDAMSANDNNLTEQAMLEDKIKATDWEATNEAIEEQVARESYLQWLQDNEKRGKSRNPPAATVTSGQVSPHHPGSPRPNAAVSPRPAPSAPLSPRPGASAASLAASPRGRSVSGPGTSSPQAGCSSQQDTGRDSPKPGSSRSTVDHGLGPGFQLRETASFLNGLPPDLFSLDDWGEDAMLSQVLAASQQEYLDSLKKEQQTEETKPEKTESEPSASASSSDS